VAMMRDMTMRNTLMVADMTLVVADVMVRPR
jgi:hypothetical protein